MPCVSRWRPPVTTREWMGPCIGAATGALVLLLCSQAAPLAQAPDSPDLSRDPRVAWLAKHAVGARSGDPKDEDFRDLAPLRQSIGSARIVMLGDPSHIGGGSFLAMSRMVKFLHREMGFDVLVFESGLYDMSIVWESIRAGGDIQAALGQGLFSIWSKSEEVHSLMDYVAANARSTRPLELAGWDPQVTGAASREHLVGDLRAYLTDAGITSDLLAENGPLKATLENVLANKYVAGPTPLVPPSHAEQEAYLAALKRLEKDIASKMSGADSLRAGFWVHELHSLAVHSRNEWSPSDGSADYLGNMLRDQQGATNLLWLADERYRGRKIIVWAATWHEFRNKGIAMSEMATADPDDVQYFNAATMGGHVWETLGNQVYVIGFTAYAGTHGIFRAGKAEDDGPIRRGPHTSVELEELFNAAGFQYAFLDFRSLQKGGEWLHTPIRARYLGDGPGLRDWTQTMDGMFFIREQKPNTEWVKKGH